MNKNYTVRVTVDYDIQVSAEYSYQALELAYEYWKRYHSFVTTLHPTNAIPTIISET